MVSRFGAAALAALALIGAACTPTPDPSPSDRVAFDLPTIPPDYAANPICAGVDVRPLLLDGSLVNGVPIVTANGIMPISWPSGFTAEFDPDLVVYSSDGRTFARKGEVIANDIWHGLDVCVMGQPHGPPGRLVVWLSRPRNPA